MEKLTQELIFNSEPSKAEPEPLKLESLKSSKDKIYHDFDGLTNKKAVETIMGDLRKLLKDKQDYFRDHKQ